MKLNVMAVGALMLAACSCTAKNEVHISYADGLQHPDTLYVEHTLIANQIKAQRPEDLKVKYDTVVAKDGSFTFPIDQEGPAEYSFRISDVPNSFSYFSVYAEPGEDISIKFNKLDLPSFTATGSPLMEGIAKLQDQLNPVYDEYSQLMNSGAANIDKIQAVTNRFTSVVTAFIKDNPKSPAAVYALNQLAQDDSFGDLYAGLTPEAKKCMLFPITEKYFEAWQQHMEAQKKIDAINNGKTPAPDFSLPNLQGKKVSLSEFKGKWVVLDFWGSWCRWCIKGFPELKEAYAKYHDKGLEVIGIDCGDTDAEWRKAVKEYDLPWVHVFNGEDKTLIDKYAVQGYPTKIIVNPQGVIVNVTVGEDPKFFDVLADFLK